MEKIKVLMVAGDMHVGGIENQLMHLLRNADKEKFQIDFTSTKVDAFYREEIENLGGKFLLIPPIEWNHPNTYCKALYRIMKNGKYDIVHSHELFHSGITLYIAKKAGIPCRFVHAHNWCDDDGSGKKRGMVRSFYNVVMRKMINRYSTVQIACSTWAGRFLYGEDTILKKTYHLVFNSVECERFLSQYGKVETGEFCGDGWINILNVARVTVVKNQMFLVNIAEEFKKNRKRIRILCAGNGDEDYEAEVHRQIKDKQLEDYIQLLGVRRDIDVLMRKSKAFVLPSKYEGMPLVMIEAQASGLPCVSASTYSPEVDFEMGNVTWLPLNAGISKWTEALYLAIEKERPEKGEVERVIREKKFDSRMFAETLCNLYQQDYKQSREVGC